MPLLYGEGATKAFRRIQYEIIRSTDDESIYAWHHSSGTHNLEELHFWGLLADSPRAFGNHVDVDVDVVPQQSKYLIRGSNRSVSVSNRGISLDLYVTPFPKDKSHTIFLAFLDCDMRPANSTSSLAPVIILQRTAWDNESDMVRIRPDLLGLSMMNNVVLPDELAVMLVTGSASQESAISQPGLRRIFVPHDFKRTRSPGGVVFYPEIKQTASKLGLRVRARSPTWQYFSIGAAQTPESVQTALYEINFELNPIPPVHALTGAKVVGVLQMEMESPSSSKGSSETCLVVGLEPLEPNPFETPALYSTPWCAFEEQHRIAGSDFEKVLDREKRERVLRMHDNVIASSFGLETRYSKLVYDVKLEVEEKRIP